jgi:hypothetical protein
MGMPQTPLTVYYSPAYVVEGRTETVTKSKLVSEMIEAGKAGEVRLEAPKFETDFCQRIYLKNFSFMVN